MNWLKLLLSILQAAPSIIHGVETIIGPGSGETKKAAVVGIMTNTATVAGASPEQVQALTVIASTVTDATVATLNAAGVFKKSP
jgi:hypothetical protein